MSENTPKKINSEENPVTASLQSKKPQLLNGSSEPKRLSTVEDVKIKKVVSGKTVQKKKSFWKKLGETFTPEDMDSVVSYVIWDVLIPAAKDTLSDMVDGVKDMVLYGESTRGRSGAKRDKNKTYVSYSSYYNREKERTGRPTETGRRRRSFDDIVYQSRSDAMDVLQNMVERCEEYNEASVADLYQLSDLPSNYTDERWGWRSLSKAEVGKIREGWVLILPKPEQLD